MARPINVYVVVKNERTPRAVCYVYKDNRKSLKLLQSCAPHELDVLSLKKGWNVRR